MAGWYTVRAPIHTVIHQLVPQGRLTPRDQNILLTLSRVGYLTNSELIEDFFNGHREYARHRLQQLYRWRLVTVRDETWALQVRGWQVVDALLTLEAEA